MTDKRLKTIDEKCEKGLEYIPNKIDEYPNIFITILLLIATFALILQLWMV